MSDWVASRPTVANFRADRRMPPIECLRHDFVETYWPKRWMYGSVADQRWDPPDSALELVDCERRRQAPEEFQYEQ